VVSVRRGEEVTFQDLTGQTFGLLKVLSYSRSVKGAAKWLCRCRCRNYRVCDGKELKAGRLEACRICARSLKSGRMSVKARARRPRAARISDPERLAAMLDERGRRLYERWEAGCRRLSVYVSRNERAEVLRELVNGRMA
jgi:hypothetical protein